MQKQPNEKIICERQKKKKKKKKIKFDFTLANTLAATAAADMSYFLCVPPVAFFAFTSVNIFTCTN